MIAAIRSASMRRRRSICPRLHDRSNWYKVTAKHGEGRDHQDRIGDGQAAADGLHLRLQYVADPAHRVDQPRVETLVHFLAQSVDHHVDHIGAGVEVVTPGVFGNERTG